MRAEHTRMSRDLPDDHVPAWLLVAAALTGAAEWCIIKAGPIAYGLVLIFRRRAR